MKVRLLSLNVDKNMPFARFQARVTSSIKIYSDEIKSFEHYENMRDFFGALQDALENDELIVAAVDTKHYLKMKNALTQALEADVQYDASVLNMLESNEDIDDDKRRDFSSFPKPATVFLSKDGMYSGFGVENGSQYLIMVPIDNERINLILRNGVVPFLSKHIPTEQSASFLAEDKLFDNEKVKKAVERLIDSGSVAAVNGTQNAEVLKSCGDSVEHFDDVFIFTPHVEDKGDVNATEYAAQLAKVSLDLSAANIGASISDIYESGDTKYVCIAVASDESATVRKLYMDNDESEDAFVESAAVELIELIGERASGMKSVGIEISEAPASAENAMKKSGGKKPLIILASVLGVIIILCAALGITYKIQGENGYVANAVRSIFGITTTAPETSTEPEQTEAPTEAPTQAQAANMKISDFMVYDLITLEKTRAEESETVAPTEEAEAENGEQTSEPAQEEPQGAPETITVNGEAIPAKEALARLVMTEMGDGYNVEAVKAQTVVIYTYLKYRDNGFVIDGVEISDSYNDEVMEAVDAVFGEYLTYNGEVALTPFFETAARKTAGSEGIFSKSYPYLRAVELTGNPDTAAENYKVEKEYTLGEMKGILLDYNSNLQLSDSPEAWIVISRHDAAVSSSIGYVSDLTVGSTEMTGIDFRKNVLGLDALASHCFTVSFDEATAVFTVTSYGSGLGVGMSKTGAASLALQGTKYTRILSTYYSGTTLEKETEV